MDEDTGKDTKKVRECGDDWLHVMTNLDHLLLQVNGKANGETQFYVDDAITVGNKMPKGFVDLTVVDPETYLGAKKATPEAQPPRPVFSTPKDGQAPDLTDSGFQTSSSLEITGSSGDGTTRMDNMSKMPHGSIQERAAVYVVAKAVAPDCTPQHVHHQHLVQNCYQPVARCSPQTNCPASTQSCVLASQTCQPGAATAQNCQVGATLAFFDKVQLQDNLGERHLHVPLTSSQVNDIWLASQGIVTLTEEEAAARREEREKRKQEAREKKQLRQKEMAQEKARVRWLRRMGPRSNKEDSSEDEEGTFSIYKGKARNSTK